MQICLGLDRIVQERINLSNYGRVGLVANEASVSVDLIPSWQILQGLLGDKLVALFGPQHGYASDVQDNMIETPHCIHAESGLPVYSLYSETREPSAAMLENIDTIFYDLQTTGCRIYTFKATLAACLRRAKEYEKKIVVLDRPNPVGGVSIEGPVMESAASSFVGVHPIPLRHGLTPGEFAAYYNASIGADLEVIRMEGWDPNSGWSGISNHWIPTSPNLPTIQSVAVFPGNVLFEGTNLSEGRGTGLPFQLVGAPYIRDSNEYLQRILEYSPNTQGLRLMPFSFMPTHQKWSGEQCKGILTLVEDASRVENFGLALAMIRAASDLSAGGFDWQREAYEYDFETLPMKLIMGKMEVVDKLLGRDFSLADEFWTQGIVNYIRDVKKHLIYPRSMKVASLTGPDLKTPFTDGIKAGFPDLSGCHPDIFG